jgi:uncharacterized membrane protein YphA (DoxX/SURF4 family)
MKETAAFSIDQETSPKQITPIADFVLKLFGNSPTCERKSVNRRVDILRWGLGFIYLWFGFLKFFPQLSSAEQLAGTTIKMMSFGILTPEISLPLLALWETAIGLALLTGKFQRLAIFSLYFHVAGTLVPLLLLPEQTWSLPPFAASLEGQYIFKNLVTIGAALVINAAEGCRKASKP